MRAISFRTRDYVKTVQAWFYKWHGQPISERLLSMFGVAVLGDDDAPLAIAYIYPVVASDIAWIGITVRDPYIDPFRAGKALKLLIDEAEDSIKRMGYAIAYVGYDSPSLQRMVAERGYCKGSLVQEYFKELV